MTVPKLFTGAELDALQSRLHNGEMSEGDFARLIAGYAWLLGLAKGRDELLERKDQGAALMLEANHQLREEIARLSREADEDDALRFRLSQLLTGVANALKGEPGPLMQHDWSNLPDVARSLFEMHAASAESNAHLREQVTSLVAERNELRAAHADVREKLDAFAALYFNITDPGLTTLGLVSRLFARMEVYELDMQNAGCDSTCDQLVRAFDEIDAWIAGKTDKTEPPEFYFGSPKMNDLWRRYVGVRADLRTEQEKF